MRSVYFAFMIVCWCTQVWADTSDTVKPGISLDEAKARLQKHGYEVNAAKYGLAMIATDPKNMLEFCPLDADIMLLIVYEAATERVHSLEILVIPEAPKADRQVVSRKVLEITPEEGGVYTLKLERLARPKDGSQ